MKNHLPWYRRDPEPRTHISWSAFSNQESRNWVAWLGKGRKFLFTHAIYLAFGPRCLRLVVTASQAWLQLVSVALDLCKHLIPAAHTFVSGNSMHVDGVIGGQVGMLRAQNVRDW